MMMTIIMIIVIIVIMIIILIIQQQHDKPQTTHKQPIVELLSKHRQYKQETRMKPPGSGFERQVERPPSRIGRVIWYHVALGWYMSNALGNVKS